MVVGIIAVAAVLLFTAAMCSFRRHASPQVDGKRVAEISGRAESPRPALVKATTGTTADRKPESTPRAGVDASSFYKNAFALLAQLSPEEKALFLKPTEEVDAAQAEALFQKIQPIMELLRQGAKADYCDWGLGPISFDTPMPQLFKSVELAKLALWNAAYRFANEPGGAMDDLAARARLGDHLSDSLIGLLVSNTFEATATNLLRQNLSSMPPETLAGVANFLENSTLDQNILRAMESERMVLGTMASLFTSKEKLATLIGMMSTNDVSQAERAQRTESLLPMVSDPARLQAEISYTQDLEKEWEAMLTLPESTYQSRWNELLGKLNTDHPLAREILTNLAPIQRRLQAERVQRQMLTTGLAILQNGPKQLSATRDPATGRTFDYIPTPTGFELRSTYHELRNGKPITMTFTQPPH